MLQNLQNADNTWNRIQYKWEQFPNQKYLKILEYLTSTIYTKFHRSHNETHNSPNMRYYFCRVTLSYVIVYRGER